MLFLLMADNGRRNFIFPGTQPQRAEHFCRICNGLLVQAPDDVSRLQTASFRKASPGHTQKQHAVFIRQATSGLFSFGFNVLKGCSHPSGHFAAFIYQRSLYNGNGGLPAAFRKRLLSTPNSFTEKLLNPIFFAGEPWFTL